MQGAEDCAGVSVIEKSARSGVPSDPRAPPCRASLQCDQGKAAGGESPGRRSKISPPQQRGGKIPISEASGGPRSVGGMGGI